MAALDKHNPKIVKRDIIGIVDFRAASGQKRMQLVDLGNGRVVDNFLVSHGKGSDPGHTGWVKTFSNRPGSNASSRGSYLTGEAYYGKHGRSLRLHGLDPENDLAYPRAIVIHGANYVDAAMARSRGRIGRSLGCFAFEQGEIGTVLERLGPGRLLFAYQ